MLLLKSADLLKLVLCLQRWSLWWAGSASPVIPPGVCAAWKDFRERGEAQAAQQQSSHLSVGHGRGFLMESLCRGSRGYREHRVFLPSKQKLPLKTLSELNTTWGNVSPAETTNNCVFRKGLQTHLSRSQWTAGVQGILKPLLVALGCVGFGQSLRTSPLTSSGGPVSIHFSRKSRGRGKMEVDHVTFRVYQFSSANVFTGKINFLLKIKSTSM